MPDGTGLFLLAPSIIWAWDAPPPEEGIVLKEEVGKTSP